MAPTNRTTCPNSSRTVHTISFDNKGNPIKGQKKQYNKFFEKRYKNSVCPIILNNTPPGWTSQCVVLEGMFIINTSPLGTHKTYGEYALLLLRRPPKGRSLRSGLRTRLHHVPELAGLLCVTANAASLLCMTANAASLLCVTANAASLLHYHVISCIDQQKVVGQMPYLLHRLRQSCYCISLTNALLNIGRLRDGTNTPIKPCNGSELSNGAAKSPFRNMAWPTSVSRHDNT